MLGDNILERKIGGKVLFHAPQVSVIIPAYNCAEYIAETLDSAFAQTFKDYEIVLVNDGSPDTEELEKVLENYFDRIIYLRQKNSGTAAARNTAIKNARGEFLAFLDSDDVWSAQYLESQIEAITTKKCDVIYANASLFGILHRRNETYMMRCPSNGMVTTESLINGECNVITSGTIARREKVLTAGMFDEDLPRIGVEDFDLWFRMAKFGTKIDYQKKVLLKYRLRPTSLSGNSIQQAERPIKIFQLIEKKYVLTDAETEKLNKRLKLAVVELQIVKGKYNLIQGNFAEAQRNFCEANKYYHKFKYSALDLFLRLNPQLVLKLFKKTRAAEVAFICPAERSDGRSFSPEEKQPIRQAQK